MSAEEVSFAQRTGRHGLRDVPLQLRRLADRLESDAAGDPDPYYTIRATIVIRRNGAAPEVMAYGDIEHIAQSYADLHMGATELIKD